MDNEERAMLLRDEQLIASGEDPTKRERNALARRLSNDSAATVSSRATAVAGSGGAISGMGATEKITSGALEPTTGGSAAGSLGAAMATGGPQKLTQENMARLDGQVGRSSTVKRGQREEDWDADVDASSLNVTVGEPMASGVKKVGSRSRMDGAAR